MTPKEKARELVSKFTFLSLPESNTKFYNAKKCALIAVDEVLCIEKEIWDGFHSEYFYWWEEVKQEIKKL